MGYSLSYKWQLRSCHWNSVIIFGLATTVGLTVGDCNTAAVVGLAAGDCDTAGVTGLALGGCCTAVIIGLAVASVGTTLAPHPFVPGKEPKSRPCQQISTF